MPDWPDVLVVARESVAGGRREPEGPEQGSSPRRVIQGEVTPTRSRAGISRQRDLADDFVARERGSRVAIQSIRSKRAIVYELRIVA